MGRTAQTPNTPSSRNRPVRAYARRLRMAPTHPTLEDRIVLLLNKAEGKVMSLRDIEQKLAEETGHRIDTFAVRDAVWRLIDKRKADFTPLRDLKAVAS